MWAPRLKRGLSRALGEGRPLHVSAFVDDSVAQQRVQKGGHELIMTPPQGPPLRRRAARMRRCRARQNRCDKVSPDERQGGTISDTTTKD